MPAKKRNRKRNKPRFQRRTKPGASPGTIQPHPESPPPVIHVMAYHGEGLVDEVLHDPQNIRQLRDRYRVVWINVTGLGDAATIRQLGEQFQLHSLALEDVVNVHQRAKVDAYDDHLFIVARTVRHDECMVTEQISMFLGEGYVLTFQERPGDCFDPVRDRVRKQCGRIHQYAADYLAYALLDAAIDTYFPIVDRYADRLEELEDSIVNWSESNATHSIQEVRNDLLLLRRSLRPHRDALNELIRDEHPLVTDETRIFLRDCYDHTIQLTELLELYRDACADLRDYHLSIVSNHMNEIMKVLTIIATIFIPLGFIAGLYGMNFDTRWPWNMPELDWPFGYPFALGLMTSVALGMLLFFYRKGWLGSRK